MKRYRNALRVLLPFLVLALGVVGAAALEGSREEIETTPPPPIVPTVEVLTAVARDVALTVPAQGTVRPATESELVAEVGGRVIAVAAGLEAGAFFHAGDVLVRIDSRDYELAVVEANAEVARAELQLALEQAEAESARREWQSLQRPGDPPDLVARKPQLAEATARLEAARARLEGAERDLDRTAVRAPYDGRCLDKVVDLGQFVQRGTRLARVYATDAAEVRLPLQGRELAHLEFTIQRDNDEFRDASGPRVRLVGEFAGQRNEWEGRIVRTEGQLDPRSRMVHVIARVEHPYSSQPPLLPGMFVSAVIEGRQVEDCVVVPRQALRGETRVLIVGDDDRIQFRDVDVLRAGRDEVFVRDGIKPGERICLTRLEVVAEGMQVRVAEPDEPAAAEHSSAPGAEENRR
jgi:RND family efflux transporter MFP subunit